MTVTPALIETPEGWASPGKVLVALVVAVIIIAAFIITCSIIRSPFYVLLAFGFVALSVPAHYWFFGRK